MSTRALERWSLPTDLGSVYRKSLRDADFLRVIHDATCVKIVVDEHASRATGVKCRTLHGNSFTVSADDVVVAAGGLQYTRLLMCSPGVDGKSLGDHSGHLWHWYMAHLEGVIADLVLETQLWYTRRSTGTSAISTVRTSGGDSPSRRIIKLWHHLPNISGWIANPELVEASTWRRAPFVDLLGADLAVRFLVRTTCAATFAHRDQSSRDALRYGKQVVRRCGRIFETCCGNRSR